MIVGLFATRYVLHWLGEEVFGAVRVATDWMGYLTLLDLGIGTALYATFSRSIAANNPDDERAELATSIRAYILVTLLMIVAGLVMASRVEWLVRVTPARIVDLRRGWFVGLLTLALAPLFPFRAYVEASQQGYRINLLILLQGLSSAALTTVAAHAGLGITGQFCAVVLAQIPVPCLLARRVLAKHPDVVKRALLRASDPTKWRELWKVNSQVLIINFGARVSLLTDGIVLGFICGPAAVVPLVLTQRAAQTAQAQVVTLGNASWAGLANLHAHGEHEIFRKRLIDATKLSAVLAGATLSPLVVFTLPFVSLWVGAQRYAGDAVVLVVILNAFLQTLFSLWIWAFMGTGVLRPLVPYSVASAVINLVASIVCTQRLGIVGPVLGTLVSNVLVYSWALPLLLRKLFGISLTHLLGAAGAPLLMSGTFAGSLHYVFRGRLPTTWTTLIIELALSGSAYLVLAWVLLFGQAERGVWAARFQHVLSRRLGSSV
jgi:O-antigen/teichoic acid export membrane protein